MKKVLVYPCGTEIGLEIHRSLCYSTHYEVYGGSSTYDHGRFVYKRHIDELPFITDKSTEEEILKFNKAIAAYGFDFIYPAMDGVVTVFSKYRALLSPVVIAPDFETSQTTRSKRKTYQILGARLPVPISYTSPDQVDQYPVFIKPDVGQGSVGTRKIFSRDELEKVDFKTSLCLEFLPGREFTVDCFTNGEGKLLYVRGRGRKRIKDGISVNATFEQNPLFEEYAEKINSQLKQRGGWFFQLKEAADGTLKLLEVASRIAGASAITRCIGVNLPLLTVNLYDGYAIDDVLPNDYKVELDRALVNNYRLTLDYDTVYVDYDDTIAHGNQLNLQLIKFLYQCVNKNIRIILLSKHDGELLPELRKHRILELFDEVVHLSGDEKKKNYIKTPRAIFIDDSFGERREIKENSGLSVFDTHMVECLLEN